ncbi:MAG: TIGR00269 family protein, partial [Thermoprotei archaeon]
ARYYPVTPSLPGLVARIKPLVMTPEKDSLIYAIVKGIEYVTMECPYSTRASSQELKNAIFYLEEKRPGTRFSMFNTYIKMIYPLIREAYYRKEISKKCRKCGEPTNAEICLFCRVKDRISAKREG